MNSPLRNNLDFYERGGGTDTASHRGMRLTIEAHEKLGLPRGADGFITWFRVEAIPSEVATDTAPVIAGVDVALFHVGKAKANRVAMCDALRLDDNCAKDLDFYFADEHMNRPYPTSDRTDVLYFRKMEVAEGWQGREIELAIVARVCDVLGAGCAVAIAAYLDDEEAEAQDQAPDQARLYQRLGFEILRRPYADPAGEDEQGYVHVSLPGRMRVADLGGARFAAWETREEPSQICTTTPPLGPQPTLR